MRLWDAQGGTLLREFEVGLSDDDAVAFSPDGVLLATGGRNQNLLVWRTKSGGLEWSLFPINVGEAEAARGKAELDAVLKSEREAKIRRADAETEALADKVRITFEYFGEPVDAGNLRMAEPVKPHRRRKVQSAGEAIGVWLRFHNGSPLPVSVATASLYLGAPRRCAAATPGQKFFSALCDGSEAALWLVVEDADGKPVPYGFDFGAGAILKPGAAVYFSVERDVLRDGHAIKVSYTFQKPDDRGKLENYGSERHARFKATDLPEPSR